MDARQHVVLLDSTSATKFSSHLVVKLPGHAFQDNAAAGRFVRSVLLASGTELTVVQGLDARTGQPVRSPFVDTAVYTRRGGRRHVVGLRGCVGRRSLFGPCITAWRLQNSKATPTPACPAHVGTATSAWRGRARAGRPPYCRPCTAKGSRRRRLSCRPWWGMYVARFPCSRWEEYSGDWHMERPSVAVW